jgi:hypothetical protein
VTGRASEVSSWLAYTLMSSLWSLLAVRSGASNVRGSAVLIRRHKQGTFWLCYHKAGCWQYTLDTRRNQSTTASRMSLKRVSVKCESAPTFVTSTSDSTITAFSTPPLSGKNISKLERLRGLHAAPPPYSASSSPPSTRALESEDGNEEGVQDEEERWECALIERFLRARSVSPAPF